MTVRSIVAFVAAVALLLVASWWWAEAPSRPAERTVSFTTTACGDASGTSGVGVIVESDRMLTAAHTVVGASSVLVELPDVGVVGATTLRMDLRTDLAMLEVSGATATPIELVELVADDRVNLILPDETRPTTVDSRAEVRIEEVRSTVRSSRLSYMIRTRVDLGDSGAGLFDDEGRLAGIVFGRSEVEADRSFAVRREEIDFILGAPDRTYRCDPAAHLVVEVL
ncbi:MAG: S1 family peptidase [Acidimicrobiales bacterium]